MGPRLGAAAQAGRVLPLHHHNHASDLPLATLDRPCDREAMDVDERGLCTPGGSERKAPLMRVRTSVASVQSRAQIIPVHHCECCGRAACRLVRHHSDYNKPLDVVVVCTSCHIRIHRIETPIPLDPEIQRRQQSYRINVRPRRYTHKAPHVLDFWIASSKESP